MRASCAGGLLSPIAAASSGSCTSSIASPRIRARGSPARGAGS
jgi:hypothetical protein